MASRGIKRKVLTLEEKVKVIRLTEEGKGSRTVAEIMGVGKTQVNTIISKKEEILHHWESGSTSSTRKSLTARRLIYPDLNEKVYDWFTMARAKNYPVTGRCLQDQAMIIASQLGYGNFTASNGWLESFQKRHSISSSVLSGEGASVDKGIVEDWTKRLPEVLKGYKAEDIFNADETGLFYRTLPNRSLVQKGGVTKNGKLAKERITVLFAASVTGEKLKPLVIGKSKKPRCFNSKTQQSIAVHYEANKKAWMSSSLFTEWLRRVNNQMCLQKRNILLLVDNCTAHPPQKLSNIKLVFLPPNTTSHLQPMDAGIIQAIKLNYRKMMMGHISTQLEESDTAAEVARSITVLHAITWISNAWELLRKETISKCFHNCGFKFLMEGTQMEDLPSSEDEDMCTQLLELVPGSTIQDLIDMDENTATAPSDGLENGTVDGTVAEGPGENEDDEDDEESEKMTQMEAIKAIQKHKNELFKLVTHVESSRMVSILADMDKELQDLYKKGCNKQSKISDYFKS